MKFVELVDTGELRKLCESFTTLTDAAAAILDLEGNILVATGWQDICTRFHRVNPDTAYHCLESDTVLAGQLKKGERYNMYKCKNGLVDVAFPISVGGEHIANFFSGQFLFEPPDREFFSRQAEEFGFDKTAYLDALCRVPIYSEDKVKAMLDFFSRLARIIDKRGLVSKQAEEYCMNAPLPDSLLAILLDSSPDGILVVDQQGRIVAYNQRFVELWAIPKDILDSRSDDQVLQFVLSQLERPGEFLARVRELYADRAATSREEIRFKDGRLFECQSTPYSDPAGNSSGRVWYFRDCTSHHKAADSITSKLFALSGSLSTENIVFTDLFDIDYLQKIQDTFAASTGVASIITFPDGTPITKPSNFCHLCLNIIRKTEKGLKNCMCSDAAIGRWNPSGPIVQLCLSGGLWDAGASITVGGKHVANWLIGQVKNEEIDENRMLEYVREIGADEEKFRNALGKVTVMSRDRFEKIADFLFLIAGELSVKVYQNIQQAHEITARMQIEAELNRHQEHLEELVEARTNELLEAKERAETANRAKSVFLANPHARYGHNEE